HVSVPAALPIGRGRPGGEPDPVAYLRLRPDGRDLPAGRHHPDRHPDRGERHPGGRGRGRRLRRPARHLPVGATAQESPRTRLDMGVDAPGSTNTRFDGEAGRSGPPRPAVLAALGSTGALLAATVLGMVFAFPEQPPCRPGAWTSYASQFQRACYTDIYPLYYGEGLAQGKVPYTGHPVEYPVLIGGAMQAAAWLVRNVSEVTRGREFFDVTVLLLAVCAAAGVLATARAAGPDPRAPAPV